MLPPFLHKHSGFLLLNVELFYHGTGELFFCSIWVAKSAHVIAPYDDANGLISGQFKRMFADVWLSVPKFYPLTFVQ